MARAGYYLMAVLSLLIAAMQLRFLFMPMSMASPDMVHHIDVVPLAFWLHVVGAAVALALGVFQFATGLRTKYPVIHRWTGRTYAVAVLFGAPAGLILALNANGGFVTQLGFSMLALAWGITTLIAFRHVRNARYVLHAQWMIRSYALALGAVTLRLQVPFLVAMLETDYTGVLPIIAWSSWVPNILIAEWIIQKQHLPILVRIRETV